MLRLTHEETGLLLAISLVACAVTLLAVMLT